MPVHHTLPVSCTSVPSRASRRRLPLALVLAALLASAAGTTSCGGGGGAEKHLVLVGFNQPNVVGVALNQPLIFTFSEKVDPLSITPDSLRVLGQPDPSFEAIVVDGNLVALLPAVPNFETYSDAGLAVNTKYTVAMPVFPAPATIRTLGGRPLLEAEAFNFHTVLAIDPPGGDGKRTAFIETRRPLVHGTPPSAGGRSDDEGCLQNSDNTLFTGQKQFGSAPGARLVCLKNEGPPRVILSECSPTHAQLAVGTPSATFPGFVDLPALRVRVNEPLDPLTVVPIPTDNLGINVQLWHVGDTDRIPVPPTQLQTNKPLIVQSLSQTEIILVSSGPVPQGTYLLNLVPSIVDLADFALRTDDRPSPAPQFSQIEASVNASGKVKPGYRIYFVSIVLPGTAQAMSESFSTNLNEHGDLASAATEPGVFEQTNVGTEEIRERIPGATGPAPSFTTTFSLMECGQTTTANWNNGYRPWNILSLLANSDVDSGFGSLKAVWKPYAGNGGDGTFSSPGTGVTITLTTDAVPGASVNGDGIYEFESFTLRSTDTLEVTGSRPLKILVRGDLTVEAGAVINLQGQPGGPGLDTDGSALYTMAGAASPAGLGGMGGPGGGPGGVGADPMRVHNLGGAGLNGGALRTVFEPTGVPGQTGGAGGFGGDGVQQGGGGGGFGGSGLEGTNPAGSGVANGGLPRGTPTFERNLDRFLPDRGYFPNANLSGGTGGGGGGADDDTGASDVGNGTVENGDDGGGGGGGGGGGILVVCGGSVLLAGTINANGGAGGSTYNFANQRRNPGEDGTPNTADDYIDGLLPGAVPSGDGGPGGGGSGGGMLFVAKGGVTVDAGAVLTAVGGSGGQSGHAALVGGAGGDGRIALGTFGAGSVFVDGAATVNPPATPFTWNPTVDLGSVGQSEWIDMFTNTANFEPPFHSSNFADLLGLAQGVDWDAVREFQGADDLIPPAPGQPPSSATGVTLWSTDHTSINTKRFVRWRWRFFVADAYPGTGLGGRPMPQIFDQTIPFTR